MAFKDKNEFEAGDQEDEFRTGTFPLESADMESSDEESPDNEEETELSDEELAEVEEFNRAQGVPEFPDDEEPEKAPNLSRSLWMARIISCVTGTLLGVAIAGVLVNNLPKSQETRAFFIFFLVLAPLFSYIWYWLFHLRGEQVAQKMKEPEQKGTPAGSEPIHPK